MSKANPDTAFQQGGAGSATAVGAVGPRVSLAAGEAGIQLVVP